MEQKETEVKTPEVEAKGMYDEFKSDLLAEVKTEIQNELKKGRTKAPAVAKSEDDWKFSEFLQAVGNTAWSDSRREKGFEVLRNKYQVKALTQGTNATAGFLVPEIWSDQLLTVEPYEGVVYTRARKWAMPTDILYIPVKDYSVTPSGGSSAFNAGVSVAVVSEGSAPGSETKPNFKQLTLTAKKVLAFTDVTNELLQNSPSNVEAIVTGGFREAIMNWIDYEALNGTDLTGLIGHAATIKVPRVTASAAVELANFAKMYRRLTPRSYTRAIWIVHPYVLGELLQMKDANNNSIWLQGFHNASLAPMLTVFGIPVMSSEFSPALGSEGDIMLVDLQQAYNVGINREISIEASRDFKFTSDLVTYRAAMRIAGIPTLTAAIKLSDGTSTVSPCVVLDDATS